MLHTKKFAIALVLLLTFQISSAQDTTHILKFDFFGPVAGCLGFSYEQPKSDFVSIDYDFGFIGLKLDDYFGYDNFVGGYAAVGSRLYFKKDAAQFNDGRGWYFKPQLMLNYFHFVNETTFYNGNGGYIDGDVTGDDFTINVVATMGSQWIMADKIVFDLWFGLGYGGGWYEEQAEQGALYEENKSGQPFKFSYTRMGYSPMVFDGGLSIGLKW